MAYCKRIKKSIKAHQYVYDAISYVLSPENRNGDEKCFESTCLNCENDGVDSLTKQFYVTRKAFNKDNEILSHHYVQSFSPNENITPELAHKIGVELAKKVAPGFQVIVSTHVDKDHIHNHFIINSVNMETGMKWKGNKTTLQNIIRPESDKICKSYGLTTIKNKSGLCGIDQETQKLAEQGKSWKVELCKALDEATQICNSKKEFVEFMKRKNFIITRYEKDITFQKVGEKKKIRASTLAKQWGDCYTKENLEKMMGFYRLPKESETSQPSKKKKNQTQFISEFEKYEKNYFRKNPPPAKVQEVKILQMLIKNSRSPLLCLLLIIMRLLIRQKRKSMLDKKYLLLHRHCRQTKYKVRTFTLQEQLDKVEKMQTTAGNIPYKKLIESQGENYRVRLALSAVPKLYAYPFFFSAKLYKDYALVTIKEKDKQLLQTALEIEDIQILEKHNKHYTPLKDYYALKDKAAELGTKIEFLTIYQKEQLSKLEDEKDRFVAIEADGKIRLAFLQQNKDYILHTLYPDKYKEHNGLFSVARNSRVNTRLRAEAMLDGQKIRYRFFTKEQIEKIYTATDNEELFAVFNKNAKGQSLGERYKIAFKESDEQKINEALNGMTKRKI